VENDSCKSQGNTVDRFGVSYSCGNGSISELLSRAENSEDKSNFLSLMYPSIPPSITKLQPLNEGDRRFITPGVDVPVSVSQTDEIDDKKRALQVKLKHSPQPCSPSRDSVVCPGVAETKKESPPKKTVEEFITK
jgi:hypothetical protein